MNSGDLSARSRVGDTIRMPRPTGLRVAVLSLLTAAAMLLGFAPAASAAPAVTYPGAISNIELESASGSDPIRQWETVTISGDWAVPAGAVGGETFGMTLPAEFRRHATGTFTITDPATGTVMADCQVGAGDGADLVCTLTDAVNGLSEVGGSFWLQAQASVVTSSETVQFDLGDTVEVVDLPGDGGIVPSVPTAPTEPDKWGEATAVDGRIRWVVVIPSGSVADGAFTITDTLDPGLAAHRYTGELRIDRAAVVGGQRTEPWQTLDPAAYQVSFAADGSSFDLAASGLPTSGYTYQLVYYTQVDGTVQPGDIVGNHAVVDTTELTSNYTVTESGGGGGTGVTYAQFSVTKALVGPQADAARGATFTVQYSVKGSDAPAKTLSVQVGQAALGERAPAGSTFVIEEIDLPVIAGVSWGDWVISGAGVTATGDGRYEVTPGATPVALTLTNSAEPVPTPAVTPTPPPTVPPAVPRTVPTEPPTTPKELALTGGDSSGDLLSLALLLVAGGVVATAASSLRRASIRRR